MILAQLTAQNIHEGRSLDMFGTDDLLFAAI